MAGSDPWHISPELQAKFDEQFFQLKPINGLLTGDQAKILFLQSGLPAPVLAQIWALADMNSDGKIDKHEFGVALILIQMKLKGCEIPKTLPPHLRLPMAAPVQIPFAAHGMVGMGSPRGVISNGSPLMGQGMMGGASPNVLASSFVRPASPVETKLNRSGSISSQDSPIPAAPSLQEWAIPQASKLKYTQYFNSLDRTRTGFLTGVQARNILLQSGLPQNILAQIWNLSDIDSDGRLGSEEFVVAMHLTDCVKIGDPLPSVLPPDLYPPSFRQRGRSASNVSTGSSCMNLLGDLSIGGDMSKEEEARQKALMNTFEDKRKENFEKGQAELERRRQALLESQRKEQEERERKEREEHEKRERIRLEQERRRQLDLEKQLAKQRELEQEKEEQRRKVLEQREAARREMDRQRQLEWERQRLQELTSQKQKEQESVGQLKKKSKTLTLELEQLNNKINDLSQHIGSTRQGVKELKSSIDEMRIKRDSKMTELNGMKMQIKDLNDRLIQVAEEKTILMNQVVPQNINNPTTDSYNSVVYSFKNKQIILNQLKNTLTNIEKETSQKLQDVENNNAQLQGLKDSLLDLVKNHEKLYQEYEQKRQQVLALKTQKDTSSNKSWDKTSTLALSDAWGNGTDHSAEPTTPSAASILSVSGNEETKFIRYRVLYAFEARNPDELSIMPGDVVMVPESQSTEPGWLGGELRGKVGWFPESYAELMDAASIDVSNAFQVVSSSTDAAETVHIVGTEMKRTLEGISEQPENGSDIGSFSEEPQTAPPEDLQFSEISSFVPPNASTPTESSSPIPGQGQLAPEGLQAVAMFPWKAKKENHLTFNKGDVVQVKEQQDLWWLGQIDNSVGWFPKSYVKLISGGGRKDSESNPNEAFDELDSGAVKTIASDGGNYYVANYTYQSQEPGDLCFQQGELLIVTKKDGDWWTGLLGGVTGMFPSNYVRLAEPGEIPAVEIKMEPVVSTVIEEPLPVVEEPVQNTKTLKKPEIVTVIAPYNATGAEQLTLEKGQLIQVRKKSPSGWWEGETQVKNKKRQLGWFPASYVKALGGSGQNSNRSTPDPITQLQKQNEEINGTSNFIEQVVTVFGINAQHEDELTFQKGQIINVINKDDPAWWRGELNGVVGLFPSNYVEPLDKEIITPTLTQGQ